ncbi:hypothetical protein PX52LOC_07909 [Limnoglobus roseus]|uniref:Uncharacterized protein n=1 Tax=Limnoglobus roseus TaxID=2598579 RepID=A0A5C1ANH1_9BACT|nr:hypothetical protein PX52LOC_07909 [Limnoglobus roseus]
MGAGVSIWQAVRAREAEKATSEQLTKTREAERAAAAQLAITKEAKTRAEEEEEKNARQAESTASAANELSGKRLRQIEKNFGVLSSIFAGLNVRKIEENYQPLETSLAGRLVKAAQELDGEAIGDRLVVAGA